jgi:ADP-ribose pyrophosphatase YjhB (NUDIX family)
MGQERDEAMKIPTKEGIVTLRVAGVCRYQEKVLFHRMEVDSYFALPGGGIEFGEIAASALKREMKELRRLRFWM